MATGSPADQLLERAMPRDVAEAVADVLRALADPGHRDPP